MRSNLNLFSPNLLGESFENANVSPPQTLVLGDANLGIISERTKQSWLFNSEAGEVIDIMAIPFNNQDRQLNPVVEVLTPQKQLIAKIDKNYGGQPELLAGLILPTSGEYTILVSDSLANTGNYLLTVLTKATKATDINRLSMGDSISGYLKPNDIQYWILSGTKGQTVDISLTPVVEKDELGIDFVMEIYAPNGQLLQQVDKTSWEEPESLTQFTFDATGDYTIWLYDDFFTEVGGYTLSVQPYAPKPKGFFEQIFEFFEQLLP
jgi:hypothetical protein